MATDDAYRLQVFMTFAGQQYMNTYAFNTITETPLVLADWTTIATDVKEAARLQQNSGLVYRSWKAVQLRGTGVTAVQGACKTEGGQAFEGNYSTSITGGATAVEPLPPQCAVVITLNTGLIGRRRRGRIYLPGYSEPDQSSGAWLSAFITTLTTNWTTFFNKYAGSSPTSPTVRLGVWSFRIATGCVRSPNPPYDHIQVDSPNLADAFRPLTAFVPRSTVYTQRRRVIGIGR